MKHLLLIFAISGLYLSDVAQSMTNTATVITISNTCINADNIPNGTYNLGITYNNPSSGSTGNVNYPCTVSSSGNVMTISVPTASFPTVSSTGYWALADVNGGTLILSNNGTNVGTLYWQFNTFTCSLPTIGIVTGTPTTVPEGHALALSWTASNLNNVTETDVYQSTDGGNTFYNVASQPVVPSQLAIENTNELAAMANNLIYVVYTVSGGFTVASNIYPISCSTCSFTLPTNENCSAASMVGPTSICNLETAGTFYLTDIDTYVNDVTWTVSPSNLAHAFVTPVNGANQLTLIRSNQGAGLVTVTAHQSVCPNNIWHQTVQLGLPASANINVNYTSGPGSTYVQGTATAATFPAGSTYSWTLTMSTGGTPTHFSGNGISFSLPPCSRGTLSLAVTTPCGTVNDGVTVFNSNCSTGASFEMSPNPANSYVHFLTIADASTSSKPLPTLRTIEVLNTAGARLVSRDLPTGTTQSDLQLPHLAAGLYMVKVTYWESNSYPEFRTLLIK